MKLISIIISFNILFLIVSPILSMDIFSTEEGCKKSCFTTEDKKPENKNTNCCSNICNPLLNCCNCNFLVSEIQNTKFSATNLIGSFKDFSQFHDSDFFSSTWHPPRLIFIY